MSPYTREQVKMVTLRNTRLKPEPKIDKALACVAAMIVMAFVLYMMGASQ